MRIRFTIGLILAAAVATAGPFDPYEWTKNRTRYELTAEEKALPQIILLNHVEFNYGFENDQFLVQSVFHRIVRVNGNEAIQNHNRISISMNNVIELMDVRARAISKDGRVTLFDKNNLKELKNEESGRGFRIFAIEGIENESEVEYFYVRKMQPRLSERSYIQQQIPIRKAEFILRTPKHLIWDLRPYNGFAKADTATVGEVRVYSASMNNIAAAKEELFSYIDNTRMRMEFKLAYNTARSHARLNTWDDAAKTFHRTLHERSKDEEKALAKYVQSFPKADNGGKARHIRAIEEKIKSTVTVNEERNDPALSDLAEIIKSKVASTEGAARLFVGVFESLGIKTEIVMTCSRDNVMFDGGFDTWNYLEEYFLYFPETQGFLAPHDGSVRYPLIPYQYTAQSGLFIETLELAGVKSGLATIKQVTPSDYLYNTDNLEIGVTFAPEMDSTTIHLKRVFLGYNGGFITPYFHLMTKDQLNRMVDELTRQTAPDASIKKWKAEPVMNLATDAFSMDVTMKSGHFIQRAGGNYLFKLGELIGPQTELYEDKARVNDVENTHNHGYLRVIKIELPAGYRLRNPDDILFDVSFKEGSEVTCLFKSTYKLESNVLTVNIEEYYKKIHVPRANYEEFRKVINAAADFNKVNLVLEKAK